MVSVTADYAPGTAPHAGYSSTMKMEINNGGATVYWPLSTATLGVLPAGGSTTLTWTGVLPKSYIGGGNLSVKFSDAFTDANGPYTSALNNVVVNISPAPTPKKTFATFNTGTITGGGAAATKALDVSGLPTTEYLLVSVTGDYAPGVAPHDGFSSTMKMEINNGSSTVYWPLSTATMGILPSNGATVLTWTGVLPKSYIGGGNLSVKFSDAFTDANGPYTSALNNVAVTIYPAPAPKKTFATFNTGTITGGGAAATKALDVSGLPNTEYLLVAVTADYAPGTSPHDGYSSTMKMEINNGGSTVYWPLSTATTGVLPAAGATALTWTGVLPKSYIGGGNLSIKFEDDFTDANGPYTSALNNVNATIYPVFSSPPLINSSLTASGTYGSPLSTYSITASGSPASYGASGLPAGLSVNTANGQITGTPLTNGTFTASIGATNQGGAGTASLVFTIGKAALTVTGLTANNKPYDGNTNATLNLGSAVLHGVVNGDNLTLGSGSATAAFSSKNIGTGKTVTISGLTISGAGSANYTFTQPTATADITAKALSITGVIANNKVYNGTTNATINTGAAALSGVVSGDTVTLNSGSAAGAFTGKAVGSGKTVITSGFTIGGADVGNYTLTQPTTTADITAAGLTLTGVTANNKVYNGTTNATINTASAALSGVVNGDAVTFNSDSATGAFSDKAVGNGKTVITAGFAISGADFGNYTLTQPTATADITAANLTITGVTANDKVYDGATNATLNTSSAALSGVVSGDVVTLNASGASGGFLDSAVANNKTVTISGFALGGVDAGNYAVTQPTATANITAVPATVVLGNLSPTYDGTAKAASAATTPSGLTVSLTYNGSASAPINAGSYTVVGTVTDANYSGAATNTLVIAKAPLTATADNQARYFNQSNPAFTGTLTGNISSDNLSVSFSTSATPTSPADTYSIVPSINDPDGRLGNYDVTLINGTLTVTVAAPVIALATNSIFYTVAQNPALLAPLAVFSSPSSSSFNGGTLTLTIVSNLASVDLLGVDTNGSLTVTGNGVSDNGSLFATYSGGATGLTTLQFAFNSTASQQNIQTLLTNLTFSISTTNDSEITNLTRVVQLDFSDGGGLTSAPVMLTLTLNYAPAANLDRISTATNLPVAVSFARLLENDSDPDGDPITLIQVDGMSQQGGTVISNATGVVYTPPADYTGADQFTYSLSDGRSGLSTGIVSLQVLIPGQISIEKAPYEWGLTRAADIGVMGLPGQSYRLLGTEDFAVWTSLQTNTAPADGFMHFFDEDATNHPYRFYRSVTP